MNKELTAKEFIELLAVICNSAEGCCLGENNCELYRFRTC